MRSAPGGVGTRGRSRLLDELCELCGYGRKHVNRLLAGKLPAVGENGRRGGPRRRYGEAERTVLKAIWLATEQPSGKTLKAALPRRSPHYAGRINSFCAHTVRPSALLQPARGGLASGVSAPTHPRRSRRIASPSVLRAFASINHPAQKSFAACISTAIIPSSLLLQSSFPSPFSSCTRPRQHLPCFDIFTTLASFLLAYRRILFPLHP